MGKASLFVLNCIIAVILLLCPALSGCEQSSAQQEEQDIQVVSVEGPIEPVNPGGPAVRVTIRNRSKEPVVLLNADLEMAKVFRFYFDVSPAKPLFQDKSVSSTLTLISGGFSENQTYNLRISGNYADGSKFSYTNQIRIRKPR